MSGHGGGRRKKKAEQHEEHVNHERWLVTYADMLTLLMVLFIVLFAISQVDQKKFMELATGMASGFGEPVSITNGADAVLPQAANAKTVTDAAPAVAIDAMPSIVTEVARGTGGRNPEAVAAQQAAERDAQQLQAAQQVIEKALTKAGLRDKALITRDDRGLTVSIIVDDLVFPADSAQLQQAGVDLIDTIAPALKQVRHDLVIEGHTNQVNVAPKNYPSEWELSSARASSVARLLVARGLPPRSLSVTGYADTRPLVPPSDPRSVRLNRRVAIVVLSALSGEQKALLDLLRADASSGRN